MAKDGGNKQKQQQPKGSATQQQPSQKHGVCSQRGVWIGLWLFYLGAMVMSAGFGVSALMVLNALLHWARNSPLTSVYDLSDDLVGVTGGCVSLIICLIVFAFFSLFVLCGKLCTKKDHPDFRYGMLTGGTFFMIFVCLQAAMSIHSSHYLVEGPLHKEMERTDGSNVSVYLDKTLFYVATVLGYICAGAYLLLFIFLMMYECSMACRCCAAPEADEPPPTASPTQKNGVTSSATSQAEDDVEAQTGKEEKGKQEKAAHKGKEEDKGEAEEGKEEKGKGEKGKVPSPWA